MDDDQTVSVAPEPEDIPAPEPPAAPPATTPEPEPLPAFDLNFDSTPEPSTEPAAPTFTDDDIAKYIASKSHDDLKHVPAYNQQVQRAISKHRQEQERQAQEYNTLAQWDNWFRQLHPAQLAQVREDPQYDSVYVKVRDWRNQGGPQGVSSRAAVAQDMLQGLRSYFESNDQFASVVDSWDDLMNEPDLSQFMTKVISAGLKKEKAKLEKAAKTQAQAYIKDVFAKRGITLPSPETSTSAPNAGRGGLTYDSYINATPEQQAKFDPDEIDSMLNARRASQRK